MKGIMIGCGFFAENHFNAWSEIQEVEICALCEKDEKKLNSFARKFDFSGKLFTDAEELSRLSQIDFVDVITPSFTHLDLIRSLAGKFPHVICQKPFSDSIEEVDEMIEICEKKGTLLSIHENFRYQPHFRKAKEIIDSGEIGELFFVDLNFRSNYDVYKNQPYLAEVERFTLMDVGVHLIDLARFFMGEVKFLSCQTQSINPKVKGEDVFYVSLQHSEQKISRLSCSYATKISPSEDPFPFTTSVMEGRKGVLQIDRKGQICLHRENQPVELIEVDLSSPSWGEPKFSAIQKSVLSFQEDFVEKTLLGKETETRARDNRKTMELTFAAYESAEKKQTVKILQS